MRGKAVYNFLKCNFLHLCWYFNLSVKEFVGILEGPVCLRGKNVKKNNFDLFVRQKVNEEKHNKTKRQNVNGKNSEFLFTKHELLTIFSDHNYCFSDLVEFYSLNICGLRSKFNCEDFVEECLTHDVCVFQETKTDGVDDADITEFFTNMGFHVFVKHRKKLQKNRSGGVITIVKKSLCAHAKLVETDTADVLWVELKLYNKCNVLLGNCYIPPESSRFFRKEVFDDIQMDIVSLSIKYAVHNVVLSGDFNARTKCELDFVSLDRHVSNVLDIDADMYDEMNMDDNFDVLGMQRCRKNLDKADVNGPGKNLLELCKNQHLLICNGRIGHDKFCGDFTTRNGSTIDYVIMNPQLLTKVILFEIKLFDPMLSDVHRAIEFSLKFTSDADNKNVTDKNRQKVTEGKKDKIFRVKWTAERATKLTESLLKNNIVELNDLVDDYDTETLQQMFEEKVIKVYDDCEMLKCVEHAGPKATAKRKIIIFGTIRNAGQQSSNTSMRKGCIS